MLHKATRFNDFNNILKNELKDKNIMTGMQDSENKRRAEGKGLRTALYIIL